MLRIVLGECEGLRELSDKRPTLLTVVLSARRDALAGLRRNMPGTEHSAGTRGRGAAWGAW